MADASTVPVVPQEAWVMADLIALLALEHGVTEVIVGKTLYDGRVTLKEGIQAIGDGRLQDPTTSNTLA